MKIYIFIKNDVDNIFMKMMTPHDPLKMMKIPSKCVIYRLLHYLGVDFLAIFRGFLCYFRLKMGKNDVWRVFLIKWAFFTKNGFGDDFRLMARVLPRPLVFQGGKSFKKRISDDCNAR